MGDENKGSPVTEGRMMMLSPGQRVALNVQHEERGGGAADSVLPYERDGANGSCGWDSGTAMWS